MPPKFIKIDELHKYIDLNEEGISNADELDLLWLFSSDRTMDILGLEYFRYDFKNFIIRGDVVAEIHRLQKRGYSFDDAVTYLEENDAPETIYDVVFNLIENLKQCYTWEQKTAVIDEIKKAFDENAK